MSIAPPKYKSSIDYTGRRIGRLLVVSYAGKSKWNCQCDCGAACVVNAGNLKEEHTRSCGCLGREGNNYKHGLTDTKIYRTWINIKKRCFNPKNKRYEYYGGRGITMCDRWKNSFEAFLEDMGPKPSEKHSIDRINNDGNYEPGNCRWATPDVQGANKRKKYKPRSKK